MIRYLVFLVLAFGISSATLQAGNHNHFPTTRIHHRSVFQRAHDSLRRRQLPKDYVQRQMNIRYPKYVGGFHYSYFRDIGVSPGDVGLRGNGIYPTPW